MPDYRKMYTILCIAADRALSMLPDIKENTAARLLLQTALLQAEDVYLDTAGEPELSDTEKERV